MPTALAELLDLELIDRRGDGALVYRGVISPVFTIGPKVHGGTLQMMVTAAARDGLQRTWDRDRALLDGVTALAVASDYLAAPDPAEVQLIVRIVKRGRTVSLAHVDVTQGERTMVSSAVTLGRPDSGASHHRGATVLDDLPVSPVPGSVPIDDSPMGEVMHLAPALDLALDADWFPAARGATGEPAIRGWVRPKDPGAQPATMAGDFPVLVCDISPPVVMNLGLFGWAPTVQLTTYVRRLPAPAGPGESDWLRFAATTEEVGQGMFAEDHLVLDATGALVAQSRQLALIPQ